jgi:hypothetical protein
VLSRSNRRNGAGPKVIGSRHFQLLRWHRALALVSTLALLGIARCHRNRRPFKRSQRRFALRYLGAGSAPCVASYSTVRALFATNNGALYRVTRASEDRGSDIGLLFAAGYANAAARAASALAPG